MPRHHTIEHFFFFCRLVRGWLGGCRGNKGRIGNEHVGISNLTSLILATRGCARPAVGVGKGSGRLGNERRLLQGCPGWTGGCERPALRPASRPVVSGRKPGLGASELPPNFSQLDCENVTGICTPPSPSTKPFIAHLDSQRPQRGPGSPPSCSRVGPQISRGGAI